MFSNEKQPIFWGQMEDGLNFVFGRRPHFFLEREDDLNFACKSKTT